MAPLVYLDECVDARLAVRLRQRGFAVTTASEQRLLAVSDAEHLAFAAAHGWLLLTHNRRDVQRLHRQWMALGREHAGIVILRQALLVRVELRAAMLLTWLATPPTAARQLYVWRDLQRLLEQGFHLAGFTEWEVDFVCGRYP